MHGKTLFLALAASAALVACGGDDGDSAAAPAAGTPGPTVSTGTPGAGGSSTPSNAIGSNAFASVEAFVAVMRQVLTGSDDTAEPLALPATAAPTSETAEPASI